MQQDHDTADRAGTTGSFIARLRTSGFGPAEEGNASGNPLITSIRNGTKPAAMSSQAFVDCSAEECKAVYTFGIDGDGALDQPIVLLIPRFHLATIEASLGGVGKSLAMHWGAEQLPRDPAAPAESILMLELPEELLHIPTAETVPPMHVQTAPAPVEQIGTVTVEGGDPAMFPLDITLYDTLGNVVSQARFAENAPATELGSSRPQPIVVQAITVAFNKRPSTRLYLSVDGKNACRNCPRMPPPDPAKIRVVLSHAVIVVDDGKNV